MRFAHLCLICVLGVACGDTESKTNNPSNNPSNNPDNNSNNPFNNPDNNPINNETELSRLSWLEVGASHPQVAYAPDGRAHMVYVGEPASIVYGTCSSICGNQDNWTVSRIFTSDYIYAPRLQVDGSGRVHLIYEHSINTTNTNYATCSQNCNESQNWTEVNLSETIGYTKAFYLGAPFVVGPNGALAFVTASPPTLNECGGDCTNAANWRSGQIRARGYNMAMAYGDTALHMVMNDTQNNIVYMRCESNCSDASNWAESQPLFAHSGSQIGLGVTGDAVRIAYNQGLSYSDNAAVQAQDNRMLFWACQDDCTQVANWSGTLLNNNLRDGDAVALASFGEVNVLLYRTDDLSLRLDVCGADCINAASWEGLILDSTEVLNADVDPKIALCGGSPPNFASWYIGDPMFAVSPNGSVMAAHGARILKKCSALEMGSYIPAMPRLIYLP